jgi:hypothetical protein
MKPPGDAYPLPSSVLFGSGFYRYEIVSWGRDEALGAVAIGRHSGYLDTGNWWIGIVL